MPVVHPAEVWKESGRYAKIGPELVRFKDRSERDMVLAMTHEEVVAILLRDLVQSYRQLPMIVYHFQTKFRDEPRSRGGLIRVREFVMKDSYSCDLDYAGPRRELREASRGLRPDLRAARPRRDHGPLRRRDHGRHGGPRVHGPQRLRRGHARPLRQRAATPTTSRSPSSASPTRNPRTSCRWRTSRRPTRRRSTRSPPSWASRSRRRRRPRSSSPATASSSWPSCAATTTSTRRSSSTCSRPAAGCGRRPSRRSRPGAWRRATARRSARAMPSSSSTSSSPGRRTSSPAPTGSGWHVKNVNVPRDYTPDHVAEITNAREGDPCPQCGSPVKLRQGHRGRQHLQARHGLHERLRLDVPRRGRRAPPDRHGLVRDRARAERGLHRRGPPRRQGHRLARRGRAVSRAPRVDRRGSRSRRPRDGGAPSRAREGRRPRDPLRRPRRVARREVHRRRAPRHALDPHRLAALASRPAASR